MPDTHHRTDVDSAREVDPDDAGHDIIGRMAGEYRLLRKLGEGGFGAVYEAEHPLLRRRAAVKVLHPIAGVDSAAVLRFVTEAQAANQIRSRHIVDVFSFGKLSNGRPFYVMDLLDGDPLDRFLRRERFLEPEQRCGLLATLQLLRPIAEALDAAHAASVVHRDLKPQNVFLVWEPSGETVPKLLDFGMAKLLVDSAVKTVSGVPVGTPLYMSPEQARGEKVDGRSDVYALGVLCHEMLTGRVPFTGDSPVAVLVSHLTQAPPRVSELCPELPPELDAPILHMLDKDAARRPASAGAAIQGLVEAAERAGYVVPAGMPRLPRPLRPLEPPPSLLSAHPITPEPVTDATPILADSERTGPRRDSRRVPSVRYGWVGIGALVALGATALYWGKHLPAVASPERAALSALPSPNGAAPARDIGAAAASVLADAPAPAALKVPEPPSTIQLVVRGVPPAARVSRGGKELGSVSQPLALPFGAEPIELTVTAPGYEAQTFSVIPDRDTNSYLQLKKRAPRDKPTHAIPSALESPF